MQQTTWPTGHRLFRSVAPVLIALWFGVPANCQDTPESAGRISVDVALVQLHATILDYHGQPVSGLIKSDVHVLENGKPQEIRYFEQEDIPVAAGILVDHSGSMAPRMAQVISAASTFASESNAQDEMFVVNFNEHVSFGLPAGTEFTSKPGVLERAIGSFPTTGRTAVYDAVLEAIHRLATAKEKEKVLILVSDGGDNASKHSLAEVLNAVKKSDAIVYCIGLFDASDLHPDPGFLRKLAHSTGGEAYFPTDTAEVVGICRRIASDIRAQYTIGYVPTGNQRDGTYRTVQVIARSPKRGKLQVRTRAGYYAAQGDGQADVTRP